MATDEEKKGLECLSDEVLAAIVEQSTEDGGGLNSDEAVAAFRELSKRTPE